MAKKRQKYVKPDTDSLTTDLKPFIDANPTAELREQDGVVTIAKPWGDDTIQIDLSGNEESLVAALNDLVLHPSFSALYHRSTRTMEFIYSAFVPPDELNRKFSFAFDGKEYACDFSACSEQLLLIADAFDPSGPSNDGAYRNLLTFKRYLRFKEEDGSPWQKGDRVAASFWLRNVDADETFLLRLTRHLNFYTYYFERTCPQVMIHDERRTVTVRRLNSPFDSFPVNIVSRGLDDYLMGLWENSVNASDVFRKYLYLYQMLEYTAFYYIQNKVMCQLQRILVAPETAASPFAASQRIIETMTADKMADEAKIEAIVQEAVNPELVWKEIEVNKSAFSSDVTFDGGFVLKALLKPDAKYSDFQSGWEKNLPTSFRRIRNALVHAREARMSDVISPSTANYERLAPWIGPLNRVAMQIAIYVGKEA